MHRYFLTGFAVCVLSAALPAIASAQTTSEASVPAVATTATVNATTEVAAPTADADLAMWNAAAAVKADTAAVSATGTPLRTSGILHVQKFASGVASRSIALASKLTSSAMRFLGTPYVFGGTSAGGFDCSGFTQHVFAMAGFRLPRTADAQYYASARIGGTPKPGDLVFFQTYERGPSHVGIALGDGRFVHASSSRGVTISSLGESYWSARYLGAKRVTK